MSFSFSAVIEVTVGLVLVYYVMGVITSSITKWLTDVLQLRAKDLQSHLRDLLEDSGKLDDLLLHPWAQNLKPKKVTLFNKVIDREICPSGGNLYLFGTFSWTYLSRVADGPPSRPGS